MPVPPRGSVFARNPAAGAAEDMDVSFIARTLEQAGNKISFCGKAFFADGASSLYFFFKIGMAVRTAEDVAYPVRRAGKQGRLDLRPVGQPGSADGAHPVFSDCAYGILPFRGMLFTCRRGKQTIREDE